MRNGEICGLKWTDIDFDSASLQVNRSLDYHDGKLEPGPVKSDRSERPVPLPKETLEVLTKEKAHQKVLKESPDSLFKDEGWLWAWEDGRPHSPDYLYKQFKKLLKKASLPDMRVHDLRHSYATLLRDQGVDMATISEMLGHYSSSFTHSVYAHQTKSTKKIAAKVMDSLLDSSQ